VALVDFKELMKQEPGPDWSPEPVQPEEMAVLIYSGGTTALPRHHAFSLQFRGNAHQIIAWGVSPTSKDYWLFCLCSMVLG